MIRELDRVVLTAAVPSVGLVSGDVGTVVHVYEDGKAFEVELMTLDGQTDFGKPGIGMLRKRSEQLIP